MKATNNNTDTLFMEIFVELLAIAKTYFQELFKNEKPGVYTLKDVYAYIANCESLETKQGKAERLTEKEKEQATKYYTKSPYYSNIDSFFINSVSYVCKVSNNIVSIEKGNFKCSFDIVKLFEYLERFKQLSGAKEKLEFVKEGNQVQESEDNCICSFDIVFNKKDKTFLTVKTKNSSRYIDNKINYFNSIRDKNDYFPDKLTSVYCGKETKEPDTDIKPVGTSENKNDTNLQESKESVANVTETSEKEYFTGCSLDGVIEYLNSKGLSVTIDKDNNIFCVSKDGDSFIREVRIWVYTEILEINTKVGVHIEKDINTSIPFSDFLEQSLINLKRHATNKVFFFMEKDGYHWEQPNAQTFHLFKNGKEKVFKNEFEAYNFVQNKENESYFDFNVSDYTDDMLEVTGLNLESIISKVKQDSPKELKVIQDIKLYDKTGKIVFTYGDGNTNTIIETTFNGDSVLQSVLQKINESM